MMNKERLLSQLNVKPAKGGPGKFSSENSIVEGIIGMAEAHARVALATAQFEAMLNEQITAVFDHVLVTFLLNNAHIRSELETIYQEAFWRRYHQRA